MRAIWRLCITMAWILAALLPANGASVIFYSKADQSFGWCAGYSYGRSESCAREQCLNYGSGCELAIECDGGWSAAAFPPQDRDGFGASCEWQTPAIARSIALLSCIYASRQLCSTADAWDGNGRNIAAKANEAFDLAWYTQSLLSTLGYDVGDIDGEIGKRTRTAVSAFQSAVGLDATGETDWPLTSLMLYTAGGTTKVVRDVVATLDGADPHTMQTYAYRYAAQPAEDTTLDAELNNLDETYRHVVLAALVNYGQADCTSPATRVVSLDDPGHWNVTCSEGDYTLVLGGPTVVVTRSGDPIDIAVTDCPGEEPPSIRPGPTSQQFKPSPNTLNGPQPGTSVVDCEAAPSEGGQKFSPNTVNSLPPSLGASAGSGG